MQERIYKILGLCLQAQEKGHYVVFDLSIDALNIWHHDSKTLNLIERRTVYLKCGYTNEEFAQAESYLKELISDVHT